MMSLGGESDGRHAGSCRAVGAAGDPEKIRPKKKMIARCPWIMMTVCALQKVQKCCVKRARGFSYSWHFAK